MAKSGKTSRKRTQNPQYGWENNLRVVRGTKDLTQAELAKLIKKQTGRTVGQTTIASIETGRISGRHFMYPIAEALGVPANYIFPYANFMSITEAAEAAGMSTGSIYKRLQEGSIKTYQFKETKFLKPEDVFNMGVANTARTGKMSIRQRLEDILKSESLNINGLIERFGPFSTEADKRKMKDSIAVILSRSPQFVKVGTSFPTEWKLDGAKVKPDGRKTRKAVTTRAASKKPSSRRALIADILATSGPLTSSQIIEQLNPPLQRNKLSRFRDTVYVVLSSSDEFVADKTQRPALWSLETAPVARKGRKKAAA